MRIWLQRSISPGFLIRALGCPPLSGIGTGVIRISLHWLPYLQAVMPVQIGTSLQRFRTPLAQGKGVVDDPSNRSLCA
jgi:hypothetical protein